MGCSLHKSSVDPGLDLDAEARWLGFSASDLDAIRLFYQRVGERNAEMFSIQALAAYSGVNICHYAQRLFRVSAATEALDLRRLITGLW